MGFWLVQPSLNTISRNGTTVQLEPKVISVLVCLAESPGQPVSKEKLLQTVWPDTFVTDAVLVRSISELRRVFEDDAKEPRVIQTIAKRGYRLVAPVTPVNGAQTDMVSHAVDSGSDKSRTSRKRWIWKLGIAGTAVLLIGVLAAINVGDVRGRVWARARVPQIHSLAVLPLKNLSGDPTQDYFADGMTDELITDLSQISSVRVISYTSSNRYKNTEKTLPEIARELGVDGVVEGSVQRRGQRVRINVQLVYAPHETHLWAQSYERDSLDGLVLQSAVAGAIAEQLRIRLTPNRPAPLQASRRVNVKAIEAYLQGNYHLAKLVSLSGREVSSREDEARKAIASFEEAIGEDPEFAGAYVKICEVYEVLGGVLSRAERWPAEKAAAEKALSLDPGLPGAHLAMGDVRLQYDWDLPGAEAEYRRALELDPNNARAHDALGDYFDISNRLDEGLREHERAQELDPGNDHLSNSLYRRREYDRAIELSKKQLELNPEDGVAHWRLFHSYGQKGMLKESIEHFVQTAKIFGYDDVELAVRRAHTFGDRAAMQAAVRQMARYYIQGQFDRPAQVAVEYARLNDKEQTLNWLNRAFASHDPDLVFSNCEPAWDSIRSDPRFQDLIRRMGLPE